MTFLLSWLTTLGQNSILGYPVRFMNRMWRSFILKRVASSVLVEDGHSVCVERAYAWKPVALLVRIRNTASVRVQITGVQYRVVNEGWPIQGVIWMKGWRYASNGLAIDTPDGIAATKECTVVLRYNRLLAPSAIEDASLGIEGVVTFGSAYGYFERPFLIQP